MNMFHLTTRYPFSLSDRVEGIRRGFDIIDDMINSENHVGIVSVSMNVLEDLVRFRDPDSIYDLKMKKDFWKTLNDLTLSGVFSEEMESRILGMWKGRRLMSHLFHYNFDDLTSPRFSSSCVDLVDEVSHVVLGEY